MRDVDANGGVNEALAELRSLLIGPEKARLDSLSERLNDHDLLAEDISHVLAAAVRLSTFRDGKLRTSLQPLVEEAIRISVQRNPAILADALFPVIGKAVRKAVANALQGMAESLNRMVEQSLSLRALEWRLEALRTGKSFGEILLVRSSLYRVEQVFLIHRNTGLILQHCAADQETARDADLISAMLTAIQDFVRDSFTLESGAELETVQAGPFSLWIQHGPKAMLAGVVRGTPPNQLKALFEETLERISREQSAALENFDGDASPFEAVKPVVAACLLGRREPVKRTSLTPVWIGAGVLAVLLLLWAGFAYRSRQKWNSYVESLANEPGIVLTRIEKKGGRHIVSGLRDPLSADPAARLAASGIAADQAVFRWERYHSLDPKFVATREFDERRRSVEKSVIVFSSGSAEVPAELQPSLQRLAEEIKLLAASAKALERRFRIVVFGSTDPTGSAARNVSLADDRARAVIGSLAAEGVPSELLHPQSIPETNTTARRRAVTFQVTTQ
jgi:OOP family OmpA-OmpF porin